MRMSKSVVAGMVLSMGFYTAVMATPAAAEVSCQKLGSEVSALIDKSTTSKNLPAARASFQAGIMECMEGDDSTADRHYRDAKSLLSGGTATAASAPIAVRGETAAAADCQKFGGEVSVLIDKSGASKNLPLARAKFQAGIMQCMEGDDESANTFYQDAKALLTE